MNTTKEAEKLPEIKIKRVYEDDIYKRNIYTPNHEEKEEVQKQIEKLSKNNTLWVPEITEEEEITSDSIKITRKKHYKNMTKRIKANAQQIKIENANNTMSELDKFLTAKGE